MTVLACSEDDPQTIPEVCYADSPLRSWTVNGEPQEPGTSIEPNAGINLDFLYSIDKFGSWSINFTNEDYVIVFADFDQLISPVEFSNFSEAEWEQVLVQRGTYPFVFEPDGRQELTLVSPDTLLFIGDAADEVKGGVVEITIRKTSSCKFLVLHVTALLDHRGTAYTVDIELEEPYVFP
ncbi:MAG: hypothetical protein RIF33_16835 [Cyclobacteriaceae bacterium]